MKRDRRGLVIYSAHLSGSPVAIAQGDRGTARVQPARRMPSETEIRSLRAYSKPERYELQQIENAHLLAQAYCLELNKEHIGETVVSLGCGGGWLDRKLVILRERELTRKNSNAKLRLLGVDMSPESLAKAQGEMEKLLENNPALKKAHEDKRFMFEYRLAMLGGSTVIKCNDELVVVPDFADIDLKKDTVIGERTADTFLAFYILALWVQNKEAAIESIAEKSRRASGNVRPTTLGNGEEYPIHINPNCFMDKDFRLAAIAHKQNEMSPDELWNVRFPKHGFRKMKESLYQFGRAQEDHKMRFALLKYVGTDL